MVNKEGVGDLLAIEVAYANPDEQVIIAINVPQETSVKQAIALSGVLLRFPEINSKEVNVGIFWHNM